MTSENTGGTRCSHSQVAYTCFSHSLTHTELSQKIRKGVSTTGTLTDNNPARAHEPDLLLERDPSSRLLLASILGGARRAAPLPRTVRHRDVWTCVYFFICPFFFFFLFYLPLRLTAPDAGLSRLGPVRHLRA